MPSRVGAGAGFFITDMDDFRWDREGCVPSEVDDCGVMPPM